jgi:hypothetical protein
MLKVYTLQGYLICNAVELNIDEDATELIIKGNIVICYKSGSIKHIHEVIIKTEWIEKIIPFNEYEMKRELFKIFMKNDD